MADGTRRRWVQTVQRECAREFVQDLETLIAEANDLSKVKDMADLAEKKGRIAALNQLVYLVKTGG